MADLVALVQVDREGGARSAKELGVYGILDVNLPRPRASLAWGREVDVQKARMLQKTQKVRLWSARQRSKRKYAGLQAATCSSYSRLPVH